jgi:hypothetical protein
VYVVKYDIICIYRLIIALNMPLQRKNASISDYTVHHPLRHADGLGLVGCMDRRLVMRDDPTLGGDKLFQQIRGGRWGLGGLATAMEAHRPNSFIALDISVADFAQGLGSLLETKGIITTKHGKQGSPKPERRCGAINGAWIIHQGIMNGTNDPDMLRNTKIIKTDLTDEEFERIVAAERRIDAAGLASKPQTVDRTLTTPAAALLTLGQHEALSATPHINLQETTDHGIIKFGVDYRSNVAFDRAAAYDRERLGAYYSSFGALEEILQQTPDAVQEAVGGVETWWNTEAAYIGRISAHDIVHTNADGTTQPYEIEVIGR